MSLAERHHLPWLGPFVEAFGNMIVQILAI
jgi:hypothetical protein